MGGSLIILEAGDRLRITGGDDLIVTRSTEGKVVEIAAASGEVILMEIGKEGHGDPDGSGGPQDRG